MSQIRLYLDEDSMHHALVVALRLRGVDVTTALEVGLVAQGDEVHLAYAAQEGRTLFSGNVRDFQRLHTEFLADGREHAGIILVYRQRYSIGERLRRLLRLVSSKTAEEMVNQMEFL